MKRHPETLPREPPNSPQISGRAKFSQPRPGRLRWTAGGALSIPLIHLAIFLFRCSCAPLIKDGQLLYPTRVVFSIRHAIIIPLIKSLSLTHLHQPSKCRFKIKVPENGVPRIDLTWLLLTDACLP